jgi:hypothetical protein
MSKETAEVLEWLIAAATICFYYWTQRGAKKDE